MERDSDMNCDIEKEFAPMVAQNLAKPRVPRGLMGEINGKWRMDMFTKLYNLNKKEFAMKANFSKITSLAAGIVLALALTLIGCPRDSPNNSKGDDLGNKGSTDITIDKRAVSTWINADGSTCIFNSDGTGKDRNGNFKYAFFSNKIVIASESYSSQYSRSSVSTSVADYVFSADGKTFIVYNPLGANWLIKSDNSKP